MATLTGQAVGGTVESNESDPQAQTLCECFQLTAQRAPDEVALRSAETGAELTWSQYAARVRRLAGGLAALGIRRGDTVALMLTNRIEFYPSDTAVLHLGATPFSIYNTSSPEQIAFLFANAGNRVVITERQFVEQIKAARGHGAQPRQIVCVDGDGDGDGVISLDVLETMAPPGFDFEAAWRAVQPDDVLTLIYTSGTTGPPKGVELTHANMLAQCRAVAEVLPMRTGARITSYLPSAHAADRWSSHYNQMVYGLQVTTIADARTIAAVLPQVRPTIWGGVPRIFEKLMAGLEAAAAGEAEPAETRSSQGGARRGRSGRSGSRVPASRCPRSLRRHTPSSMRKSCRSCVSESALTEPNGSSPGQLRSHGTSTSTCWRSDFRWSSSTACRNAPARSPYATHHRPGSEPSANRSPVSNAAAPTTANCSSRGPIVMRGYRGDPTRTAEALDANGWLHTGDIARDRRRRLRADRRPQEGADHQLSRKEHVAGEHRAEADRRAR